MAVSEIHKAQKPEATKEVTQPPDRGPVIQVPQIYFDAYGIAAEPGQVAITLASRFLPYQDGTVELKPIATAVLRASTQMARSLATELLKQCDVVDVLVHQSAQAQLKAALNDEAQKPKAEAEKSGD